MIELVSMLVITLFFTSCTVSIIMTDTHGSATDVVDSTPKTETTTDAKVDMPLPV